MTAVVNEYSYELEDFLLDDDLMGFDFSSTSSDGVDTNSITSDSPFLEPGSEFIIVFSVSPTKSYVCFPLRYYQE
jgi:hypothetical protein